MDTKEIEMESKRVYVAPEMSEVEYLFQGALLEGSACDDDNGVTCFEPQFFSRAFQENIKNNRYNRGDDK